MRSTRTIRSSLIVMVAVFALVAAACGDDDGTATTTTTQAPTTTEPTGQTTTTTAPPAPTTTAPPATTTTAAPPEAVTVTFGMGNLAVSGVPWTGVGSPSQYVWSSLFDALTYIEKDGSVAPALATDWSTADGVTWTFNLRSDVEFQNGEPFNADAVVATFDTVLSEEGRATYSANVNNYSFINAVTKVDDDTVEITLDAPNVLLPNVLSIAYIVPPAYWASEGAEGFATAPIGTGPFTATRFDDQEQRLAAWDGSWRGTPNVDEVAFLNLNDAATRLQALQSGQVDVAQSISPDQLDPLEDAGFTLFSGRRGTVMSLALIANRGGPLAIKEVRQALNYAVDTELIVEQLLAGLPTPGVWPSPGVNGYDPDRDPYPYDPDLARDLLDQAGFGDGFDMVAEITVGAFPADSDIYEAMAGFLGDVGVEVELRQIDFSGDWLPKFLGRDGADWEGDAFGLSWNAAPLIDGIRPFNFYRCGWANEFFCDEDAVPLIDSVNSTFDVGERNATLAQLLDHTKDNPPAIWLVEVVELWAHVPDIGGFSVDNFNIRLEDLTVN